MQVVKATRLCAKALEVFLHERAERVACAFCAVRDDDESVSSVVQVTRVEGEGRGGGHGGGPTLGPASDLPLARELHQREEVPALDPRLGTVGREAAEEVPCAREVREGLSGRRWGSAGGGGGRRGEGEGGTDEVEHRVPVGVAAGWSCEFSVFLISFG